MRTLNKVSRKKLRVIIKKILTKERLNGEENKIVEEIKNEDI